MCDLILKSLLFLILATAPAIHTFTGTEVSTNGSMPGKLNPVTGHDKVEKNDPAILFKHWEKNYETPQAYTLRKFSAYKWVFIGEYHRIKHDVEFISSLIPLLHEHTDVRHLALEFLCLDYTHEANHLITAENYDRREVINFFKKQDMAWPYKEYLDIYKAVWESNQKFAQERGPFKLIGLRPLLNWELINYGKDQKIIERERNKQKKFDEIMAKTLETESLKKGFKALIYSGIAHATAKFSEYWVHQPREQLMRMGNMVYRPPYKQDMFFICLHAPFYDISSNKDIYPFDGILDRLMLSFQKALDSISSIVRSEI